MRLQQRLDRLRHRRNDEHGMSLIEIMVAMLVIVVVLMGTARIMMDTFTIQQNTESLGKSTALARDYMERSKQAPYSQLGFYELDEGFREYGEYVNPDTGIQEETVVIPVEQERSSLTPTDTRTVGGIVYNIRTDITTTDSSYAYAPKRITVTVTWLDAERKQESTTMSIVRSPNASEQIPPALDLTEMAGSSGAPSSPTYYDEINQYAGTASDVLGREFRVKVLQQGTSPVTDVMFYISCSGEFDDVIEISWNSPPSGWNSSIEGNTYRLGYYGAPTGISCDIENAAWTQVTAINNAGWSAPMDIAPTNFLVY